MSFTQILAILVALLALVQFFLNKAKWSITSKIITLIVLAIASVFLLQFENISALFANSSDNNQKPVETVTAGISSKTPKMGFNEMNVVDSDGAYVSESEFEDSFGNTYDIELVFDYDNSTIIFSPLGEYSKLKAIVAIGTSEPEVNTKHSIEIFADGESIYSTSMLKTDEPIAIDLNIGKARQIEIIADRHVIIGDGLFYN